MPSTKNTFAKSSDKRWGVGCVPTRQFSRISAEDWIHLQSFAWPMKSLPRKDSHRHAWTQFHISTRRNGMEGTFLMSALATKEGARRATTSMREHTDPLSPTKHGTTWPFRALRASAQHWRMGASSTCRQALP